MIKAGSSLLVIAIILWYLGYIGIIFQSSFVMLIVAITIAAAGAAILFLGVLKDRMKEKEEDKDHDYREY